MAAASALTPCAEHDLACPAGTYAANYANPDPAAYPMPDITYAVVPTSTLPYATATAVKDLLTNLVTFSHSAAVPAGYAPLPDAIYQSALTGIEAAVHSAPAPPPAPAADTTTTTTTTPASSSTSGGSSSGTSSSSTSQSSGSGFDSGLGAIGTSNLITDLGSSILPNTDSAASPSADQSTGPVAAPPAAIPTGFLLVDLAATTRYLLPAIILVALGSLIGGALLLFGPGASTRRRRYDGEVV